MLCGYATLTLRHSYLEKAEAVLDEGVDLVLQLLDPVEEQILPLLLLLNLLADSLLILLPSCNRAINW
jgi:hypothetical protein